MIENKRLGINSAKKIRGYRLLFLLSITVIVVGLLIGYPSVLKRTARRPASARGSTAQIVGMWNGFRQQLNIVECLNLSSKEIRLSLRIRDHIRSELADVEVLLSPHGTKHLILNDYPIADRYGTYLLHAEGGSRVLSSVSCKTLVYRRAARENKPFDYAFSIPAQKPVFGSTHGLYNSMNPAGLTAPAVENWLSVLNLDKASLSADVILFDQSGQRQRVIAIEGLAPGEQRDLSLLRGAEQESGLYSIIPRSGGQGYAAYLIRYGMRVDGTSSFAFSLPASRGMSGSILVPVSTMGPADNWLEIGNMSDSDAEVALDVYSRDRELLHSEQFNLTAHAQRHLLFNEVLGESGIGFSVVRAAAESEAAPSLVAESVFYDRPGEFSAERGWAYASPAYDVSNGAELSGQNYLVFPLNTFAGAANWLKLIKASGPETEELHPIIAIYDREGREVMTDYSGLVLQGSLDIALHESVGADFVGQALVSFREPGTRVEAELIRAISKGLNDGPEPADRTQEALRGIEASTGIGLALRIPPLVAKWESPLALDGEETSLASDGGEKSGKQGTTGLTTVNSLTAGKSSAEGILDAQTTAQFSSPVHPRPGIAGASVDSCKPALISGPVPSSIRLEEYAVAQFSAELRALPANCAQSELKWFRLDRKLPTASWTEVKDSEAVVFGGQGTSALWFPARLKPTNLNNTWYKVGFVINGRAVLADGTATLQVVESMCSRRNGEAKRRCCGTIWESKLKKCHEPAGAALQACDTTHAACVSRCTAREQSCDEICQECLAKCSRDNDSCQASARTALSRCTFASTMSNGACVSGLPSTTTTSSVSTTTTSVVPVCQVSDARINPIKVDVFSGETVVLAVTYASSGNACEKVRTKWMHRPIDGPEFVDTGIQGGELRIEPATGFDRGSYQVKLCWDYDAVCNRETALALSDVAELSVKQ